MDLELSIRAGNYYTNLIEQGVGRANAIEFTRLQFGLNDEQLRHVVAHNFILDLPEDGAGAGGVIVEEDALSDLLLTYAEAREARSTLPALDDDDGVPYYGD